MYDKIRFKDLEDGSVRCLRSMDKYKQYDKDVDREKAMVHRLFSDLKNGTINCVALNSDRDFRCYHRSPKNDGAVQLSAGFYSDGELIPCYDRQFFTADDMYEEGVLPGVYAVA